MQREKFNFANTTIRRSIIKGCAVELSTTAIDNAHAKQSAYLLSICQIAGILKLL